MIIAIDGPAGAGKSTIAAEVARRLGFRLIDTGAIYRTVAWLAREQGVPLDDGPALAALAGSVDLEFRLEDGGTALYRDGVRVGDEIRTPENGQAASKVSALPEVRAALLEIQREMGRAHSSVLEGRDIGTVVFPDADVKIFLSASPSERARRRVEQLREKGVAADYDAILREIEERDHRDSTRAIAPLVPAPDAIEIDATAIDIEGVVRAVLAAAGS